VELFSFFYSLKVHTATTSGSEDRQGKQKFGFNYMSKISFLISFPLVLEKDGGDQ
jgi:hypothetical protein